LNALIKNDSSEDSIFRGSTLFTALLVIFTLGMVILGWTYGPGVRLVPLIIGVPTLILSVLVLLGEWCPSLLGRLDITIMSYGESEEEMDEAMEQGALEETGEVGVIVAWMVGLLIGIYLVGFILSIGLFVLVFLHMYASASWLRCVLVSVGVVGSIYGTFELFIGANLYSGILMDALLGIL